ncbi:MAG: hypothetical protein R3200_16760 [Xanthomonadales bacterium]|nr:hypothetical protein [Xanthomonadales bacterium]
MSQTDGSQEMLFRSMQCFSDDGKLDVAELENILEIATRDGEVTEDEKRVLKNIFYNLTSADLNPALWKRVEELIVELQLDDAS